MALHSYIGTNTTLKGDFECDDDFLIEGSVEGSLYSKGSIVIGRKAVVRGDVCAQEVAISGIVVGTIVCAKRIDIFEAAKIVGTIQTPVIKMEKGAKVNGRIIMSQLEEIKLISQAPDECLSSDVEASQ